MPNPVRRLALALALCAAVPAATLHAGTDIDLGAIGQPAFATFAEEIGVATAYNPVSPAEPLGTLGFDIGVSATLVDIDNGVWNQAVAGADAPSSLVIPRIQARKGLPFGIDVGVSYISVPSSNVAVWGGELRKAILEGGAATPAVAVLAHYSALSGVDDLDLTSYGVDLGISKGVLFLTPYAGAGMLWYSADPKVGGLTKVDDSAARGYVGVRITPFPVLNLVAQADLGPVTGYTLRVNLGF
ncbi:MAG: hypothetical protein HZA24_09990 [Nitrospirae bacterium]|nr:hypothetical protein [Nitrospirota bacterium]